MTQGATSGCTAIVQPTSCTASPPSSGTVNAISVHSLSGSTAAGMQTLSPVMARRTNGVTVTAAGAICSLLIQTLTRWPGLTFAVNTGS